jgi:hypothetical protein
MACDGFLKVRKFLIVFSIGWLKAIADHAFIAVLV